MNQAQGAQGFDQVQLARVEFAEILVAGQHVGQLARPSRPLAGQQHPQILHGRAHAASSKSTKWGPSSVHSTLPAWQSPCRRIMRLLAGALVAAGHAVQRLVDHAGPGGQQLGRNEIVFEQIGAGLAPKVSRSSAGRSHEGPGGADRVDAADEAADPFQHGGIVQFGRAPAAAGEHGEAEAAELVQRVAVRCAGPAPPEFRWRPARSTKACSSRMAASLQRSGR